MHTFRPVTRGGAGGEATWNFFRPLMEKCVGNSSRPLYTVWKIWAPLRKLFVPPGVQAGYGPAYCTTVITSMPIFKHLSSSTLLNPEPACGRSIQMGCFFELTPFCYPIFLMLCVCPSTACKSFGKTGRTFCTATFEEKWGIMAGERCFGDISVGEALYWFSA